MARGAKGGASGFWLIQKSIEQARQRTTIDGIVEFTFEVRIPFAVSINSFFLILDNM